MLKKLFKKIYGTKEDSTQHSEVVSNEVEETKEEEIVIENSEEVEIETTEETTEEALVEEPEQPIAEDSADEVRNEETKEYENNFLFNQSPDAEETKLADVEEPEQPIVEESTEEALVEESEQHSAEGTEQPISEDSEEEEALVEEPEQPVFEEKSEEALVEEPEQPIVEEKAEEALVEEPEQPVFEEKSEEALVEEPEQPIVEEKTEEVLVEEKAEEVLVEELEQPKFKNDQALFLKHNDMLDDEKEVSGYTARANHLRVINEYNNEIDRNDYVQAYFRLVSVFKIFYKYRDVATVNEELLVNVKMQVELFKAIEDKSKYEFYRESDGWLYKDNKWSPKSIACFKNYIILHEKNNMIEEAIAMCDLAIELGYENSDGTKMGIRGRKAKLEKMLTNK